MNQQRPYFFAFGAAAPFFRAAHLAFMAAANFARPSGVIPVFFFFGAFTAFVVVPLDFAHLAR